MNISREKKSKLPNFLIIGAAKSGTTSLHHYLGQHPDVFMPEWKEPSFFASSAVGGIQDFNQYKALFDGVQDRHVAIGEASVAYLYDADAPRRIKEFLGDEAQVIVLLRNPVDMAYSLWGHMTRVGAEDKPFGDAVNTPEVYIKDSKDGRYSHEWLGNFLYKERVLYAQQLQNYFDAFDAENVHVFIYEEFFEDTELSLKKILALLGVSQDFDASIERKNSSGGSRSAMLQKFLRYPSVFKNVLKVILPRSIREVIKNKLSQLNRYHNSLPPLSDDLRKELEKYFDNDVRDLEKMLGRSLNEVWF